MELAKDVNTNRSAVAEAAGMGTGLWVSYLFFLLYLAVAAGAVTHRNLLLEDPVKLPFLSLDLPLVAFFALAPALFIISHTYLLINFALLAAKVGRFDESLTAQVHDDEVRNQIRRQLPNHILVQILAGPPETREGVMGLLLRTITWLTVVVAPVLLLLFMQIQFLPHHTEWVSCFHRLMTIGDIGMLWTLWPAILKGTSRVGWVSPRRAKGWAAAAVATTLFSVTIATFPGEWLNENLPSLRILPRWSVVRTFEAGGLQIDSRREMYWSSLHNLIFNGAVDTLRGQRTSLFSNTLVLPGLRIPNDQEGESLEQFDRSKKGLSLRGRDLNGAVLIRADLRKVDFSGVKLRLAQLQSADLRRAQFGCSDSWQFGQIECADLSGALLNQAQLQGALMDGARLQGTGFLAAKLQGASMVRAKLQGAILNCTQLQGASLDFARLEGASLWCANLQGASLDRANLQGADLSTSHLEGASFHQAQLQGAFFGRAKVKGTWFGEVFVWRSDLSSAEVSDVHVAGPIFDQAFIGPKQKCPPNGHCRFDARAYAELQRSIEEALVKDYSRKEASVRIQRLDPDRNLDDESEMSKLWSRLTTDRSDLANFRKILADSLLAAGCEPDDGAYAIEGFLRHRAIVATGSEAPALAARFLDQQICGSAKKLLPPVRKELSVLASKETRKIRYEPSFR